MYWFLFVSDLHRENFKRKIDTVMVFEEDRLIIPVEQLNFVLMVPLPASY